MSWWVGIVKIGEGFNAVQGAILVVPPFQISSSICKQMRTPHTHTHTLTIIYWGEHFWTLEGDMKEEFIIEV